MSLSAHYLTDIFSLVGRKVAAMLDCIGLTQVAKLLVPSSVVEIGGGHPAIFRSR